MPPRDSFDREYYDRYYENPRTRAVTPRDIAVLARHVLHYLAYLRIPVNSALDLGCGIGLWRGALHELDPGIHYVGVESSDYACGKYDWTRGDITTFKSRTKFDLVICQSVFQYLPSRSVDLAIENMARLCRGALYLEIVTREDLEANCEHSGTDPNIHVRSDAWYRRKIKPYFHNCGGGVFIPADSDTVLYSLEYS